MARPPVSSESVERALKNAMRNKWIDRWQRHPGGGHIVYIRQIGPQRFLYNQETHAFCLGMAAVDRNRQEYIDPSEIMSPEGGEKQ